MYKIKNTYITLKRVFLIVFPYQAQTWKTLPKRYIFIFGIKLVKISDGDFSWMYLQSTTLPLPLPTALCIPEGGICYTSFSHGDFGWLNLQSTTLPLPLPTALCIPEGGICYTSFSHEEGQTTAHIHYCITINFLFAYLQDWANPIQP